MRKLTPEQHRLQCSHCGGMFTGTHRQVKRARSEPNRNRYCSSICATAARKANRRPLPYSGTCRACGAAFESRTAKLYCSLRCYRESPELKERARAMAKAANDAWRLKASIERDLVVFKCAQCGKEREMLPGRAKRRKFCNQRCYRGYMRDRFDRWIASNESIGTLNNYDEFLSAEELFCLVDGCGWQGKNLSNHMNLAHGVRADEFKRAAGFNLTTGVIAAPLAEAMANRPQSLGGKDGVWFGGVNPLSAVAGKRVTGYKSREGKEHRRKAVALIVDEARPQAKRQCAGCGEEFTPVGLGRNAKYCTRKCRDTAYAKQAQDRRYELICAACGGSFKGNKSQATRAADGLPVCCSIKCRQALNGSRPHHDSVPIECPVGRENGENEEA